MNFWRWIIVHICHHRRTVGERRSFAPPPFPLLGHLVNDFTERVFFLNIRPSTPFEFLCTHLSVTNSPLNPDSYIDSKSNAIFGIRPKVLIITFKTTILPKLGIYKRRMLRNKENTPSTKIQENKKENTILATKKTFSLLFFLFYKFPPQNLLIIHSHSVRPISIIQCKPVRQDKWT